MNDDIKVWSFSTRVATNLLIEAKNFPEISRELANSYVPPLISIMLKKATEVKNVSKYCK